ncbi:MAG: hypothetical protein ABEK12_04230 [Candidatus Nanohaloarchaea archaeon]
MTGTRPSPRWMSTVTVPAINLENISLHASTVAHRLDAGRQAMAGDRPDR